MTPAEHEDLFDLLPAAWGMDDQTFEELCGLPTGWLYQWRLHERKPSENELGRVRRLHRFHRAIRLVTYAQPNYPAWWRRTWDPDSFIGRRSPLDALLQEPGILDRFESHLRAQF